MKSMPTRMGTLTFSAIMGSAPDDELFAALKVAELDIWWNLALELGDALPRMSECAGEVLWARIADYAVPSDVPLFAEQLDRVVTLLGCDGRVHVSCHGGRGRTGLALACIRMLLEDEDADVALDAAQAASGGPETNAQRAFVHELQRSLRG